MAFCQRARDFLVVFVGFVVAFLVTTCGGLIKELRGDNIRWLLFFLILVALVCTVIIAHEYNTKYTADQSEDSLKGHLEKQIEVFALPVGIFVFGGGSLILTFFYFIMDAQCLRFYSSYLPEALRGIESDSNQTDRVFSGITRISFNVTLIVFVAIQMPFLASLSKLRYRTRRSTSHHCILLIAWVDVALWLFVFYKESDLLRVDSVELGKIPMKKNVTLERACYNYSSAVQHYTVTGLEHSLFPFNMEFLIVSLEILLHVWMLPYYTANRRSETNRAINEASSIHGTSVSNVPDNNHAVLTAHEFPLIHPSDNVSPTTRGEVFAKLLATLCNKYTAVFAAIIEIVLIQYYILNYNEAKSGWKDTTGNVETYLENSVYMSEEEFDKWVNLPTIIFRLCCRVIPATLVGIYCAKTLYQSRTIQPNSHRLNANYIVLFLAMTGAIIFTIGLIVTAILQLHTNGFHLGYVVILFEGIGYCLQSLSQVIIFYYTQRRHLFGTPQFLARFQGLMTYLAMFNFTYWLTNSFLEAGFESNRVEFSILSASGRNIWRILVRLCLPPWIYFRYISVVLLLRVKRLMKEPYRENSQGDHDERKPIFPMTTRASYGAV